MAATPDADDSTPEDCSDQSLSAQFRIQFPDRAIKFLQTGAKDEFLSWASRFDEVVQSHSLISLKANAHVSYDALFLAPYYMAYGGLCRNFGWDNKFHNDPIHPETPGPNQPK